MVAILYDPARACAPDAESFFRSNAVAPSSEAVFRYSIDHLADVP